VLAGAGGYNTHEVIELARECEKLGADGILSVTPYYNKPTQEGLYEHYKAIAAAIHLPIVVYSVQGRTGVNVEPATLARLATIANIVGVKEASGNIAQQAEVLHRVPERFTVLSGDDAITLPLISLGGHGLISVVSNQIPAEMTALVRAANQNNFAAAREIQRKWLPLMQINFVESNPIPVKWGMARMGLLEANYRLPMVPPSETSQKKIESVLDACGLLTREEALAGRH
jgi:4-hydroxy-tetrahydrodipicolinate synthase